MHYNNLKTFRDSSTFQLKNISSINCSHKLSLHTLLVYIIINLYRLCHKFAKFTLIGIPMAIPLLYWKNRPENSTVCNLRTNMLSVDNHFVGILGLLHWWRKLLHVFVSSLWSMFWYRDWTSMVTRKISLWVMCWISALLVLLIECLVSWIYDNVFCASCFKKMSTTSESFTVHNIMLYWLVLMVESLSTNYGSWE